MEAKEILAVITCLLTFIASGSYIYLTAKEKSHPTLSTWLIFLVATAISMSTYIVDSKRDVVTGSLLVIDFFNCLAIFIAIAFLSQEKMRLKPFEKHYLYGAAAIVAIWIFSSAFIANLLVQALICYGYFPTFQNLIFSEKNPEPFRVWTFQLSASIVSLYPAIAGGKFLAILYSARSSVMIAGVLLLMLRLVFKSKTLTKT